MVKPIFEQEASVEVKKQFALLKKALNTSTISLFFSYIAAFPEYLTYINNQLVSNLVHPTFIELRNETLNYVSSLVSTTLSKSDEINNWINQYKNTPSFYIFQKDINKIIEVNISLTYIFIALREAIKGWALASKNCLLVHIDQKKIFVLNLLQNKHFSMMISLKKLHFLFLLRRSKKHQQVS